MAYIHVIEHQEAEGALKGIYDDLLESRGKLAEVHKILSLNPDALRRHMELYMSIMFSKSPLLRYQREMLGIVVSRTNKCAYCVRHHMDALLHFWKDEKKAHTFASDWRSVELNPTDTTLCRLAASLTQSPHTSTESLIEELKAMGLSDRAILDATLVIAYFNFVNRLVLGLGVELEPEGGQGYHYD